MKNVSSVLRKIPSLLALSACLLLSASGPLSVPAAAETETTAVEAKVGRKAPDFTLADINGKEHKLDQYKGKTVVLEWFNEGCPFVKKHYESHNMQNLQKEYTGKGVIWLTINSSAPNMQGHHSNDEYKKIEKDWSAEPTAFLVDSDGKVGHLYGAKTTPHMYIINKDGELVYAGAIDDTPGTDVSEVAKSKNYVKAALDEILAGKAVSVASTKSYGCSVKYKHDKISQSN